MFEQNMSTDKDNTKNFNKPRKKIIISISLVLLLVILFMFSMSGFNRQTEYEVTSLEQLPIQLSFSELQPGSSGYMEKNMKGYGVIVPLQGERVEILAVGKGKPGIDITYKIIKIESTDYLKEIKAVVFPNPFSRPVGFRKVQ
jgi:hypothetical protein